MHSRTLILTALAGGPLIGALLGLAIDPAMKQAPEPAWHGIAPDPIVTQPQRIVQAGPQDLSPTWYLDRMPTWKRREAMREAAMYEAAMYDAATYGPIEVEYPEPATEPMDDRAVITVVRGSTVAEVTGRREITPLDEAAEQAEGAARQARTAITDAQPAAMADRDDAGDERVTPIPLDAAAGA